MKIIQLSVSSTILVSILSACSQPQLAGRSGSQLIGGAVEPGAYYESEEHRKKRIGLVSSVAGTSQNLAEVKKPIISSAKNVYKPKVQKVRKVVQQKPRPAYSLINAKKLPHVKLGKRLVKVKSSVKPVAKTRRVVRQKVTGRRVLVRAPRYSWVKKRTFVRKSYYKTRTIPAKYRTIVKRKKIKSTHYVWRKGRGAVTRISKRTGRAIHRVKVPATYRTVKRRILVKPARKIRTFVPAVYRIVNVKKRISDAIYKTIKMPAQYSTKKYKLKANTARYVLKPNHAKTKQHHRKVSKHQYSKVARKGVHKQYQKKKIIKKAIVRKRYVKQYKKSNANYQRHLNTNAKDSGYFKVVEIKNKKLTKKVSANDSFSKYEMDRILKNKKLSQAAKKRSIVYRIQKSLKDKGFDPGALDGKMGAWTSAALRAFQSSKGLAIGELNNETFAALGMTSIKKS